MKINILRLSLLIIYAFNLTACSKPDDIKKNESLNNEVNAFVWKGLNDIYLWQADVPDLNDKRFATQNDYYAFLNKYSNPKDLFDALLYKKGSVDKFSYIVEDYTELEKSFEGNSNSNGVDFRLIKISNTNNVAGYVRYIANNSDASTKAISRGDFFLTVDGKQLTVDNYYDLLFGANNTYTLGMASIDNNSIKLNGKTVSLTKTDFTENPILISKVIESNGVKIGYLMYNQFIANFDTDLNAAIAQLKSKGISELVLDLRYNPGGRVSSAIFLSSMITGQYNGKVFSKEEWNPRYQAYFQKNKPDYLINLFTDKLSDGSAIATLNLNKVYILTTDGTASASELVINCLRPYINVVQIGETTTGKYTASITLYDSADFSKKNINTKHTYAMQPLVLKSANSQGVTDYFNGLVPDYPITYTTSNGTMHTGEDVSNLGILGDVNEPFLSKAIALITGSTTRDQTQKQESVKINFENLKSSKDFTLLGNGMYK